MGVLVRQNQINYTKQHALLFSLSRNAKVNKPRDRRVKFVENRTNHRTNVADGNNGKLPPALTSNEIGKMWWDKNELNIIKKRNKIICSGLKYRYEKKLQEFKLVLDKTGHSSRGLESIVDPIRRKMRRDHLEDMMSLQGARAIMDESCVERIYKIAAERTGTSVRGAISTAQSDAIQAYKIYFSDEELRKLLHCCASKDPRLHANKFKSILKNG